MDTNKIYSEIRKWCEDNSDLKIVLKYSRYFKEGFDAHGLDTKLLEIEFVKWKEKYLNKMKFDDAKKLCELLYASGKYDESGIAVKIFKLYDNEYRKRDLKIIKNWLDKYASTWAHTDVMSWEVIVLFFRKGIIKFTDFKSWRESKSIWTRRAVPVSFIKIICDERITSLIDFIKPMIIDKDKPVQQGLGWFLREVWKKEPKITGKFLLEIKNTAPRTIIQYATEKMEKSEKLKYKAGKKISKNEFKNL